MASLSARRAWIEIIDDSEPSKTRKLSLSARRAWIEITLRRDFKRLGLVALRKESVDRNANPGSTTLTFPGRSPQGERG